MDMTNEWRWSLKPATQHAGKKILRGKPHIKNDEWGTGNGWLRTTWRKGKNGKRERQQWWSFKQKGKWWKVRQRRTWRAGRRTCRGGRGGSVVGQQRIWSTDNWAELGARKGRQWILICTRRYGKNQRSPKTAWIAKRNEPGESRPYGVRRSRYRQTKKQWLRTCEEKRAWAG